MRKLILVLIALALFPTPAYASWSRDRYRQEVYNAARYYHLTAPEARYLQSAAIDIMFILPGKPAHESSGGARVGSPGACYGPYQFNTGWHLGSVLERRAKRLGHKHTHGWRACRSCSTYRFVKVYKQGGRSALYRHWAATLGR